MVTAIDPPGPAGVAAPGIDNVGQVVVVTSTPAPTRPFRLLRGPRPNRIPGAVGDAAAVDINMNGDIVGDHFDASGKVNPDEI